MRRASAVLLCASGAAAAAPGVYDYIVVGAGSAGCPVAAKLARAGKSVLLLEAGPDDDWKGRTPQGLLIDPFIPGNVTALEWNPEIDDRVMSEPVWQVERVRPDVSNLTAGDFFANTSKRAEFMPRARIVGGCSMHNWMIFLRPSPHVHNAWGNGWSWDTLFPKYKAIENDLIPDHTRADSSQYHGHSGECFVSEEDAFAPESAHAFMAAATKAGLPYNADINGASRVGVGPWPKSQVNGSRWSSSKAFLTPAVRALPNFELVTRAMVTRVVFNGTRAVGVEYVRGGAKLRAAAAKEVILSAGSFRSPQLLMLSGVGPADTLADFNIPIVAESRGVGRNLQDHGMTCPGYQVLKPGAAYDDKPDPRYDNSGHGAFFRSSWCRARNCSSHDMQLMCGASPNRTAYCCAGLVGHIQSSPGFLTLKSTNPRDYPAIYPNYLGAKEDIDRIAETVKFAHSIFQQDPDMYGPSTTPGANVTTDDIAEFVQATVTTIYHPVGTCKMGPDSDPKAVVDPALKVRGVQGLRVADASIMPLIPDVNTDLPSRMVGYHAADLILADA